MEERTREDTYGRPREKEIIEVMGCFFGEGLTWKLQTTQAVNKTIDYSPQTVNKATLLKIICTQFFKLVEGKLLTI